MEGLLAMLGFSMGAAVGVKAGREIGTRLQPALDQARVAGQFAGVTVRSAVVGLGEAISRPFAGVQEEARKEHVAAQARRTGKASAGRTQRIAVVKE